MHSPSKRIIFEIERALKIRKEPPTSEYKDNICLQHFMDQWPNIKKYLEGVDRNAIPSNEGN